MLLGYKVLHLLHPDVQMPVKYNPMLYILLLQMWLFILITRHNKENTKAEALGDAFVENGKERM